MKSSDRPAEEKGGLTVVCACGRKLSVPPHLAGKAAKCSGCGERLSIPGGPPPADPRTLFGQWAVDAAYVSRERADECLRLLIRASSAEDLGTILVKKGYLVDKMREWILRHARYVEFRARERKLAVIALREGTCTEEQVRECLELQKQAYLRRKKFLLLTDLLVENGHLSSRQASALRSSGGEQPSIEEAPTHPVLPAVEKPTKARRSGRGPLPKAKTGA